MVIAVLVFAAVGMIVNGVLFIYLLNDFVKGNRSRIPDSGISLDRTELWVSKNKVHVGEKIDIRLRFSASQAKPKDVTYGAWIKADGHPKTEKDPKYPFKNQTYFSSEFYQLGVSWDSPGIKNINSGLTFETVVKGKTVVDRAEAHGIVEVIGEGE